MQLLQKAEVYRSCSAMKLGECAEKIFPQTKTLEQSSGPIFYTLGFLVALILWAFGLVWLFFASASIVRSKGFPLNIGSWGFTFPLGGFAASTVLIGDQLPSTFFKILGTVSTIYTFRIQWDRLFDSSRFSPSWLSSYGLLSASALYMASYRASCSMHHV